MGLDHARRGDPYRRSSDRASGRRRGPRPGLRRAGALAYDATHDQLTGLVNRGAFLHALEAAGTLPTVLYIDLDGFKPINDTYGHRFGDTVLRHTAERLRNALRAEDVVGRLGGDEFAIALTNPNAAAHAEEVAERLLVEIGLPIFEDGLTMHVRASVGIAVPAPGSTDATQLMHQADLAMYEAKRRGDHTAQRYHSQLAV